MDGITSTAHLRGSHQLEAWKSGPISSGPILSASSCLASPARTNSLSPGNLCKMVEHKYLLHTVQCLVKSGGEAADGEDVGQEEVADHSAPHQPDSGQGAVQQAVEH